MSGLVIRFFIIGCVVALLGACHLLNENMKPFDDKVEKVIEEALEDVIEDLLDDDDELENESKQI